MNCSDFGDNYVRVSSAAKGFIMPSAASNVCEVCGKPGNIHLHETFNGEGNQRSRTFCLAHVPPQLREKLPFGPHRTPAEEVAFLRTKLAAIGQHGGDPELLTKMREQVENLIADIEAGKRRMGDED
jgi:hypothetical protein